MVQGKWEATTKIDTGDRRISISWLYWHSQAELKKKYVKYWTSTVADTCHILFFLELATRLEYKPLEILATHFEYYNVC